jgi:lipopolysaccharide export system permease protein
MRLPITLSLYIGRQYLLSIVLLLAGLLVIVGLMDAVELIRRTASKEGVTLYIILKMALFKLPSMVEQILPFGVLIGGMMALSKLTRSHELIIARAAGVSIWQFMLPPLIVMLLFGAVFIAAYNPLAAALLSRFEKLDRLG